MSETKQNGWKRLKEKYDTVEKIDAKIQEATAKGRSAMYIKILGYLKTSLQKQTPATTTPAPAPTPVVEQPAVKVRKPRAKKAPAEATTNEESAATDTIM